MLLVWLLVTMPKCLDPQTVARRINQQLALSLPTREPCAFDAYDARGAYEALEGSGEGRVLLGRHLRRRGPRRLACRIRPFWDQLSASLFMGLGVLLDQAAFRAQELQDSFGIKSFIADSMRCSLQKLWIAKLLQKCFIPTPKAEGSGPDPKAYVLWFGPGFLVV